jgi:hypothetical protein
MKRKCSIRSSNSTDEAVVDVNDEKIAWPRALAGDKGYRADWIDTLLLEPDILPVIPSKETDNREARGLTLTVRSITIAISLNDS